MRPRCLVCFDLTVWFLIEQQAVRQTDCSSVIITCPINYKSDWIHFSIDSPQDIRISFISQQPSLFPPGLIRWLIFRKDSAFKPLQLSDVNTTTTQTFKTGAAQAFVGFNLRHQRAQVGEHLLVKKKTG